MTKKNLIIDCQLLQTDAWHRGMGKYTLQLLGELSSHATDKYNLHLIFNESIDTDSKRFDVIKYICPNSTLHKVNLPLTSQRFSTEALYKHKLDSFIESEFKDQKNLYLITALFMFDYFAEYPTNVEKLLLFYDLTPFMFWRDLGGYFPPHIYMKRFRQILEADLIFAISQTTKNDLVANFGISDDNVVNINGGFTKISNNPSKPTGIDTSKKYILFPSGDLPHKNNEMAVQGFEEFNKARHEEYNLLITSTFSKKSQVKLKKFSKNIIFTGNVSDEELEWLYEHATVVLFSSKYEGLGMPILDAVANNKPISASNIPVFREMTDNAYNFFNPQSAQSIAQSLDEAKRPDADAYKKIMEKYTWQETRKSFLDGLNNFNQPKSKIDTGTYDRVAVVAIYPGISNQIGRLAEPLYKKLSANFTIDYYLDPLGLAPHQIERPTYLDHISAPILPIGNLSPWKYRKYKQIVYIIDDNVVNSWIVQIASVLPGILLHSINSKITRQKLKTVFENNEAFDISKMNLDEISELIKKEVKLLRPSPRERIIKQAWFNRNIIKKLLREES